jgi:hypothetical protein
LNFIVARFRMLARGDIRLEEECAMGREKEEQISDQDGRDAAVACTALLRRPRRPRKLKIHGHIREVCG